ncbi:MAG: hypothetical protein MUF64_07240 [Polyangiaceae bacterium]|nr:hypothetical protein [Polyangiaceae bacterium]
MAPRPHALLPLGLLAACAASAPSPPASTPAPTASVATAEPAPTGGSGWTPVDPRAVRCGVDDRPRNVLGAVFRDDAGDPSDPIFLKIEMVAPAPMPPNGAIAKPRFVPADMAPEPIDPGSPPLRIFIERRPVSLSSGAPLPAELSSAFASIDPQFDVCNTLVTQDFQGGNVTMELELASSGAPLRVLPVGDAPVSPHTRCLLERACQYQTRASLGQLTRVQIPLVLTRERPPPPPPPPPPQPTVRLDTTSENASSTHAELQLQLRTIVADAARACGGVPGRAQTRFLLDLSQEGSFRPQSPRRPSPRLRVAMPREFFTIQQVRTQQVSGQVPMNTLSCVVAQLSGRGLPGGLFTGKRTERVLVTWNP